MPVTAAKRRSGPIAKVPYAESERIVSGIRKGVKGATNAREAEQEQRLFTSRPDPTQEALLHENRMRRLRKFLNLIHQSDPEKADRIQEFLEKRMEELEKLGEWRKKDQRNENHLQRRLEWMLEKFFEGEFEDRAQNAERVKRMMKLFSSMKLIDYETRER